jgi:hypothetical protein
MSFQEKEPKFFAFFPTAYRIVAGNDDKKYVPVSPMDEDILKADSGWNPFPKEPIYPKIDRRLPWSQFYQPPFITKLPKKLDRFINIYKTIKLFETVRIIKDKLNFRLKDS